MQFYFFNSVKFIIIFFLQKLTLKDLAEKCHLPTKIFHFKYIKY